MATAWAWGLPECRSSRMFSDTTFLLDPRLRGTALLLSLGIRLLDGRLHLAFMLGHHLGHFLGTGVTLLHGNLTQRVEAGEGRQERSLPLDIPSNGAQRTASNGNAPQYCKGPSPCQVGY